MFAQRAQRLAAEYSYTFCWRTTEIVFLVIESIDCIALKVHNSFSSYDGLDLQGKREDETRTVNGEEKQRKTATTAERQKER